MERSSAEPDNVEVAPLGRDVDVRVLVVDDQDFFRGVLCEMVSATSGFAVVGEAACGEEALRAADVLCPDFVLMDVRMPRLGGIKAARMMMDRQPHLVVLLVSAQDLPELPQTALSGLAVSFAHKRDLRGSVLRETWEGREESGEGAPLGAPH